MLTKVEIRLARRRDASEIGIMSRNLIEQGLGWSWTPERITRHIREPESVVLVAQAGERLAGFAIMRFAEEHAHLDLLAVRPEMRRLGMGRRLLDWLNESALVAGISLVYLEVRADNREARDFYQRLGFKNFKQIPGYYSGRETAICMARDLWCGSDKTRS